MSIHLIETAAASLDELVHDVIFVGGATIPLWITDPAAPPARPTKDVDVIVEVTTRTAYYDFEAKLRERGFHQDQHDGLICRWRQQVSDLILDVMPADPKILGFASGSADQFLMPRAWSCRRAHRYAPPRRRTSSQ